MAWFPCKIGGGSGKDGDGVLILENGQISDTSQYLYPTYTDLSIYKIAVARVTMDRDGTEFVGYGIVDCTNLPSDITVILRASGQGNVSISITFSNTSITQVRYPGDYYNTYLDIEAFDFGYAPKPTVKQGTFVSASTQHGIVDVNVGFKPDLIMVKLPFTGGDTSSYWEKGMSWAETTAFWNLKPVENVTYLVELGRTTGETGIQAINYNGFSFMSNGGNTQGVTCEYVAVKYEAEPQPTGDVYTIEQGNTLTGQDEVSVNTENDKLYMFFTGNHSGSFINANVLVGNTSYFEIISGIGVAAAIIQATSDTVTYDGGYTGDYYMTEVDIFKNGVEDLSAYCMDRASSWVSSASISANIGDYYLIADTVNNESGTITGADILIEETLTHPVQPLNVKIRIIKATSTTISLSSGNNLYYRRFGLFKEI